MIVATLQVIAAVLALVGAIFSLLAAVGLLRLPDFYTRVHAASKAGVVGAGLVLAAVALAAFDGAVVFRAIAGILFLVLTTPVSAHLLARAAYFTGLRPDVMTRVDELEAAPRSKP